MEPATLGDRPTPGAVAAASSMGDVVGFGVHVDATIDWAVEVGRSAPAPGTGRTRELWEILATSARRDVAAARILEPHLDALAILHQAAGAGRPVDAVRRAVNATGDSSWGVFAAEARGTRLTATRTGDGWVLEGTKPWCSLASRLSHALVTAWVSDDERALFAVDLRSDAVAAHRGPWVSRGLSQISSTPVDFTATPATPVGAPGWYLSRPGFRWGGAGVAACWWGGALPLLDALRAASARSGADQLSRAWLGEADSRLWAAGLALAEAARQADAGANADEARVIAERVRAVVSDAVERVLAIADTALGPAPLTADEDHARRVADLRVYLRQHHGGRDLARLGTALTAEPGAGAR
ncbi:acyl-CoA dehydrogenase [Microbacterium sp. NPDC078428]|uniref:acyl-CoA dehydrogenase n=1 Tax=Microbacterium sp. NPDC078428 TaxID=3364190 RepID=UPI0037CAECDC